MLPFILFAALGFFTAKLVSATIFSDKPINKIFVWISAIVSAVVVMLIVAPILLNVIFIIFKHMFDSGELSILESAKSSAGAGWLIGYLSILTMGDKQVTPPSATSSNADHHPLNAALKTVKHTPENETPAKPLFSKQLPDTTYPAPQTNVPPPQTALGADDLWANAMAECNSSQRKAGLWARCFAETDGDENKAQARYIKQRVAEEQQRIDDAKLAAEQAKRVAIEAAQRQADLDAKKTKGYCPNCSGVVFLDVTNCVHCQAIFDENSIWKIREYSPPNATESNQHSANESKHV